MIARYAKPLSLICALIIGCTFVYIGVSRHKSQIVSEKKAIARKAMNSVSVAASLYWLDCGAPPATIDQLLSNHLQYSKWPGPYLEDSIVLIDPWGRLYTIAQKDTNKYAVFSYGSDGIPSDDDMYVIISTELSAPDPAFDNGQSER